MERRHFDEIKTQNQIPRPAHQVPIQLKTHPLVLEKHIYFILGALFVLDTNQTLDTSQTLLHAYSSCVLFFNF